MRGSCFAYDRKTHTGKKQQCRVLTIFSCDQQETKEKRVSVRMMIIDLGLCVCVGGWAAGVGGCAHGRAAAAAAVLQHLGQTRAAEQFFAQIHFMVVIQGPELNDIFHHS